MTRVSEWLVEQDSGAEAEIEQTPDLVSIVCYWEGVPS